MKPTIETNELANGYTQVIVRQTDSDDLHERTLTLRNYSNGSVSISDGKDDIFIANDAVEEVAKQMRKLRNLKIKK